MLYPARGGAGLQPSPALEALSPTGWSRPLGLRPQEQNSWALAPEVIFSAHSSFGSLQSSSASAFLNLTSAAEAALSRFLTAGMNACSTLFRRRLLPSPLIEKHTSL